MNLAQLKALCEAQGQPKTGNKSVRIQQLPNPTAFLGKKAKKAEAKAAQSHPVSETKYGSQATPYLLTAWCPWVRGIFTEGTCQAI